MDGQGCEAADSGQEFGSSSPAVSTPSFAMILKNRLTLSAIDRPENASIETEEERIDFVKNHISTQYHLIGTCAMGEVVDDKLKVRGVDNLRVIDASVFPGKSSKYPRTREFRR